VLLQRHDVDAALFQHRPLAKVDGVHAEGLDLLGHGGSRARQEAGVDPVGRGPEAQVEARGLHLRLADLRRGLDLAAADQLANALRRKDARCVERLRRGPFHRVSAERTCRLGHACSVPRFIDPGFIALEQSIKSKTCPCNS
jgi:hypothetical protein